MSDYYTQQTAALKTIIHDTCKIKAEQGVINSLKNDSGENYVTNTELSDKIDNLNLASKDKENIFTAQNTFSDITSSNGSIENLTIKTLTIEDDTNAVLDKDGLSTPQVTTDKILLEGEDLKDLLANSSSDEIRITSPHALGDFYFSITPHMPDGVLPLNGSEVSRTTYSDLYDYILTIHNELVTSDKKFIVSEEEWQNISIENNGYVPYYSYGTGEDLFRLPRMSGYLKATGELDEAGNYIAEGLPNITGEFNSRYTIAYDNGSNSNGSIISPYSTNSGNYGSSTADSSWGYGFTFDASRSNSIYGNSEHVTPETNALFIGVWALTAFTQVGTANLSEIKEILSQCETILGDSLPLLSSKYDNRGLETSAWKLSDGSWLDGRIYTDAYNKILQRIAEGDSTCLEMKESELLSTSEFPENFLIDTDSVKFRLPLFVVNVRTIIKEYQEGTEWYRIYSDGYLEQGGLLNGSSSTQSVNFLIPFTENPTLTFTRTTTRASASYDNELYPYSVSTTNFTFKVNTTSLIDNKWFAFGYAASIPPREEWEVDFNYYFKVSHGVDEGRINIEEKLTEFEETAYTRLDEVVEEVSKDYVVHVDKQVGELYFSFDNYCPDGVIPLDGRLVSRATYADLWEWVQEKGLVKDDALITTNDENTVSIFNEDGSIRYCQWYGSGDGLLTFRMPKINGYLGATGDNSLAGQYIAEGLPNITGSHNAYCWGNGSPSGSFTSKVNTYNTMNLSDDSSTNHTSFIFDASLSSPIYGNSEHVTPETNTLFIGVWAITASKAAVFDMREIEEILKSSESYLMNNVPLFASRWDRDGLGNLGWVKADGSWVDGRHYTGAYAKCVEHLVNGHEDFIDGQVATISDENFDKFIVDRIGKRFRLPISNGQREYADVQGLNNPDWVLYWKLAHEFYVPAQAEIQEKLDLIDTLVAKTDINLPTLSSRWDSNFAENIGWVKSEGQWLNGNTYHDAYELMVSRIGINDKFIEATEGTELTDENADKFLIDTTAVKFRLPLINGERVLIKKYYEEGTYGHNSYEIYSDGYCEQKYSYHPAATSGTLNFLYPFKNTKYNVTIAQSSNSDNSDTGGFEVCTGIAGEGVKKINSIRLSIQSSSTTIYIKLFGYVNIPAISEYNCGNYLFFKLADEVPSTIVNTQVLIDDLKQECDDFKDELSQKTDEYQNNMNAILALGSDYICGCMIPDYTTETSITIGVETIMPCHAWIKISCGTQDGDGWAYIGINVNGVSAAGAHVSGWIDNQAYCLVKKGDVVKVSNSGSGSGRTYSSVYYRLSGATLSETTE